MNSKANPNVIVIYHGDCRDGGGGAYAAWKHFGDKAEYIPTYYGFNRLDRLEGNEVYAIDFCYKKEEIGEIESRALKLVVLDHHISAKESIELTKNHVFDLNHSGAVIAWNYFHPNTQIPRLLQYIEDYDLWRFALPKSKEIGHYLDTLEFKEGGLFDLHKFDKFVQEFENQDRFNAMVISGSYYGKYVDSVIKRQVLRAEKVIFEGYEVLTHEGNVFRSKLGMALAEIHPPFSIIWSRYRGKWHISLRGNGTVDLSKLAMKYGGGGHPNAAGFTLSFEANLPFKFNT